MHCRRARYGQVNIAFAFSEFASDVTLELNAGLDMVSTESAPTFACAVDGLSDNTAAPNCGQRKVGYSGAYSMAMDGGCSWLTLWYLVARQHQCQSASCGARKSFQRTRIENRLGHAHLWQVSPDLTTVLPAPNELAILRSCGGSNQAPASSLDTTVPSRHSSRRCHGKESKRSLVRTESARASFTMFSRATLRSPRSTPPT